MSAVLKETQSRKPAFEWLPVLAGLMALYVPTIYRLATGSWQLDDYAHGPIILAVILWLIWDRRQILLQPASSSSPGPGLALLVAGLGMYALGRPLNVSILEIGSLLPVLGGVLLAMRGPAAIRAYWFMLVYLVYLVPLPGIFVDAVTGPLKQNVSAIAEYFLYSAGYPIARSGVVLTVGQYQLLVADACSGLNSMFSLTAVGLLYLYLVSRRSLLHNVLILVALIPIAFAANVLRVMFLILVTYHFGDAAGQGFLHGFSGMALFLIALVLVLLLDAVLARLINPRKPA